MQRLDKGAGGQGWIGASALIQHSSRGEPPFPGYDVLRRPARFGEPSDGDFGPASDRIMPIPLRPDVTVYVQDLPHDLTEAEAGKIAAVVRAFAAGKPA